MPDLNAVIAAFRSEVATAAGVAKVPEVGTDDSLDIQESPYLAYRPGEPERVEGFALLDTAVVLPVTLYYAVKDAAGVEGQMAARTALLAVLNAVAPAHNSHRVWDTVPAGLCYLEAGPVTTGPDADWAYEDPGWSVAAVTIRMTVLG